MDENNENINATTEDAETTSRMFNDGERDVIPATETATEGTDSASNVIHLSADKNAAKSGAGGNVGVYVHKFKKPFEYEGKKYITLNFYFERLTGDDVIDVENEMLANGEYAIDLLLSRNAQSKLASKASGVADNVIRAMPMREFNSIINAVRDFLIDSGY